MCFTEFQISWLRLVKSLWKTIKIFVGPFGVTPIGKVLISYISDLIFLNRAIAYFIHHNKLLFIWGISWAKSFFVPPAFNHLGCVEECPGPGAALLRGWGSAMVRWVSAKLPVFSQVSWRERLPWALSDVLQWASDCQPITNQLSCTSP